MSLLFLARLAAACRAPLGAVTRLAQPRPLRVTARSASCGPLVAGGAAPPSAAGGQVRARLRNRTRGVGDAWRGSGQPQRFDFSRWLSRALVTCQLFTFLLPFPRLQEASAQLAPRDRDPGRRQWCGMHCATVGRTSRLAEFPMLVSVPLHLVIVTWVAAHTGAHLIPCHLTYSQSH